MSWCAVQRCKVLQQQAVDEDVAASHLAQEDAFSGIIEEARVMPGNRPAAPEQEAQDVVSKRGESSIE